MTNSLRYPSVSFVIPALNSAGTIRATLASIFALEGQERVVEVIVVDNGSDDGTPELAGQLGARVIHCPRRGAGAARNAGAREARGEFLAFVDSDVVLEPAWLRVLLDLLQEAPYSALLGRVIPQGEASFLNRYRTRLGKVRYCGTNISLLSPAGLSPTINTAACLYRRALFIKLGGFDESMIRLEDTELSFRLYAAGGGIAASEHAVAHVYFDLGLRGYLRRSFPIGRAIAQFGQGWNQEVSFWGAWESNLALILDPRWGPAQRSFLLLNVLLTGLGVVTQKYLGNRPPQRKVDPRLVARLTQLLGLPVDQRLISLDHSVYLNSTLDATCGWIKRPGRTEESH